MERFLYRLARSPYERSFVLKGALMMRVWEAPYARPTKDIDLLGQVPDEIDAIERTFREICAQDVEPDGMVFHAESVRAEAVKEAADYPGVRLRFLATLENAEAHMQVDVAFGDVVVPEITPYDTRHSWSSRSRICQDIRPRASSRRNSR